MPAKRKTKEQYSQSSESADDGDSSSEEISHESSENSESGFLSQIPYIQENFSIKDGQFLCEPCRRKKRDNRWKKFSLVSLLKHLKGKCHKKTATGSARIQLSEAVTELEVLNNKPGEGIVTEKIEDANLSFEKKEAKQSNDEFYFRLQASTFLIQNNLPFSLANSLLEFVQLITKTHNVEDLQQYSFDANNISQISSGCLGSYFQSQILDALMKSPFSISLDETSSRNNEDCLPIAKLLGLFKIEESKTGENLYNLIYEFLFSGPGELRIKNFMGISTDHASNMISKRESGLTNRFSKKFDHLMIVHDLCHALNLCLMECIKQFPAKYLNLIKDISNTFSHSPQKAAKLKTFIL